MKLELNEKLLKIDSSWQKEKDLVHEGLLT